jgi:WD40 repeat protein
MSLVFSAKISPDGRYVAAGDFAGMLRIWDFRSGRLLQRWNAQHSLSTVAFASDGKGLLSGGGEKSLRLWDINLMVGQSGSRSELVGDNNEDEKECLTFQGHTVRYFIFYILCR